MKGKVHPVTGQPLRLNHYRYRSVAECQFKEACNNVETDHAPGAGGWRVNAHQSVAEGGNDVCTLDGESRPSSSFESLSSHLRRGSTAPSPEARSPTAELHTSPISPRQVNGRYICMGSATRPGW